MAVLDLYGIVFTTLKAAMLLGVVSFAVLVLTYTERKVLADIQIRLGPMETGGRARDIPDHAEPARGDGLFR